MTKRKNDYQEDGYEQCCQGTGHAEHCEAREPAEDIADLIARLPCDGCCPDGHRPVGMQAMQDVAARSARSLLQRKNKRRVCITSDQATPHRGPLRAPCSDCPWRRDSLAGWLGPNTPAEWVALAHGEARIDCHALRGPQCAGAAIYRANVSKRTRGAQLRLPSNVVAVFAAPSEFLQHHERKPVARRRAHTKGARP